MDILTLSIELIIFRYFNILSRTIMGKVLIVSSFFYPAFKAGGPVRSLCNLIEIFKQDSLYEFDIFCKDRDLGDSKSYNNINSNSWKNNYKGSSVYYIKPGFISRINFIVKSFAKNYNVIYLNSFFDVKFSLFILSLIKLGILKADKIILAPRGELSFGAMTLKSTKKICYIKFFKCLFGDLNISFHYTSQIELDESKVLFPEVKSILCSNMHEEIPLYSIKDKEVGAVNLLFLSRISPKKNLLLALESLVDVKIGIVNFDIVGEIDDQAYWNKCLKIIPTLHENVIVRFHGPIPREEVKEIFIKTHVFILPTLNENYGHAIVEAAVHSNVLLISQYTPWTDLSFNCNKNDSSMDYYTSSINRILSMDSNDFNEITKNTYSRMKHTLDKKKLEVMNLFD